MSGPAASAVSAVWWPAFAASPARAFAQVLALLLPVVAGIVLVVWQQAVSAQVESLRDSRFRFSLHQVKAALESGLRLGFAPADLPAAQGLIDQVLARQQDILSVDVFDAQGRVLFSTDQSGVGDSVPPAWATPCLAAQPRPWQARTPDGALQCLALVDGFERTAGGVLLRHRLALPAGALALPAGWPLFVAALVALGLLLAARGWRAAGAVQTHVRLRLAALDAGDAPAAPADLAPALAAMQALDGELTRVDAEADHIDRLEAEGGEAGEAPTTGQGVTP